MNENEAHKNRKLIRLQTWDYRWAGSYFITICTQDREHFFGKIVDGKMQLSQVGVIADILWHEMQHRSKKIELGDFVVMPNHIHGILILNDDDIVGTGHDIVGTGHALSQSPESPERFESPQRSDHNIVGIGNGIVGTGHGIVGTGHALSLPVEQRFQNIGKNSISSIIGGYKSAVTKHANRLGYEFGWQSRFHDHIIRNEKSFHIISEYIINNPKKWEDDKFYR